MNNTNSDNRFCLNDIIVEPNLNRITIGHNSQRITTREMEVLMVLVHNANQLVSREELLDRIWGDSVVNDEALTLIISRLRKTLRDDPKKPHLIDTIPKKGYRLAVIPHPCSKKRISRTVLGRPVLWIAFLVTLLIVFISLFIRVNTEYVKLSEPQNQTSLPEAAPLGE